MSTSTGTPSSANARTMRRKIQRMARGYRSTRTYVYYRDLTAMRWDARVTPTPLAQMRSFQEVLAKELVQYGTPI